MKKLNKLIILNKNDNIAVTTKIIFKDEKLQTDIIAKNEIEPGFKIALNNIKKGENIIKYGEIIGKATKNISKGELVHVNNVEGLRGRGDKSKICDQN